MAVSLVMSAPLAAAGRLTEFPTTTGGSGPYGITLGPDGRVWFTENLANKLGRMAPDGTMTELPIVTAASSPMGITLGPDGRVYFVEHAWSQIGVVKSLSSPIGPEYQTISLSSFPTHIVTGPDGAVYFTEDSASSIGRLTPAGWMSEKACESYDGWPWGIFSVPGGIAYTENTSGVASQWFVGGDGSEAPEALAAGSQPTGGAFATDGATWIAEAGTNKLLRQGAGGSHELAIPTPASGVGQMIAGRRGDVWFVETAVDKLGHATSGGVVTEYALSAGAHPLDLTWGPDGNIWITENGLSQIARFAPAGDVNGDGLVDVSDVFYLINYLFAGGPAPQ